MKNLKLQNSSVFRNLTKKYLNIVFSVMLVSLFLLITEVNASVYNVPSSQFPCNLSSRPYPPAEDNCLQSAINAANPGDTILLQPGRTFVGPFLLRYKEGNNNQYITIRTASLDIPSEGHKVNPSFAHLMPKVVALAGGEVAFRTELKVEGGIAKPAHHYILLGLEITQQGAIDTNALIRLGRYRELDGAPEQNSFDRIPHHFIIDRCYFHGNPNGNLKNGMEIHSANTNVINSYISEVHSNYAESHGIISWNGSGPFKIINNVVEGSASNIFFGGASPAVQNLVPSDIEIRHNILRKPPEWYQAIPHRSVKNLLELKNARRVLIDRNLLENNWADAQNGTAVQFTPRNDDGDANWITVEDVMFSNNIVRRSFHGMIIARSRNGNVVEQPPQRISIINNLFAEIDPGVWCGACSGLSGGKFITNFADSIDVRMEHNTILQTGNIVSASGVPNTGFVYKNNLSPHNDYGFHGDSAGIGNSTLQTYFPNAEFSRNIIARTEGGGNLIPYYPTNNEFPQTLNATGFVDNTNSNSRLRNYRLSPNSSFRNQADDAKDIGANIDAFNTALRNSDFDSDGKTEITVFRPSTGDWFIRNSADASDRHYRFGLNGDIPVAADYDGDGQTDYAVFRPSSKIWYVVRSSDSQLAMVRFGLSEDIPVPADYDGDGKTDYAVFRPSNGNWYVQGSLAGFSQIPFGIQGDKPVVGDYDGDGKSDYAVWRPSSGTWYIYRSFSRDYLIFNFGTNGDIPIQGDFDGDQRLDVGVWRPSEGVWYINQSRTSSLMTNRFGLEGDTPILGDFDGDGKTDFSVWRPSSGTWYSQQSRDGFRTVQYGENGDVPVTSPVISK
jgi:hypothetical protein